MAVEVKVGAVVVVEEIELGEVMMVVVVVLVVMAVVEEVEVDAMLVEEEGVVKVMVGVTN